LLLVISPNLPEQKLSEVVNSVRQNPDKWTAALPAMGAPSHLATLLLAQKSNLKITTVPYKGTGPAMNDLLGGQVDLLCDQTTQTVPIIKENRVKAYGVTTLTRLSSLGQLPTLDEQGLKGFEVKVWHGMYVAKGTPSPIVEKINTALRFALQDTQVRQRLADLSSDVPPADKLTPRGLQNHLEAEIKKWTPVIQKAGIYAD
jgi:tripartite-type tricarboxylate transporter receptor subunit TctC